MPVLSEIFDGCPKVKILETFIENNNPLYIAQIIKITKLPKMTVNSHIHKLSDEGIIQKAGEAGKIQYYRLNKENSKVSILLNFKKFIDFQNTKESEDDTKEPLDEPIKAVFPGVDTSGNAAAYTPKNSSTAD
jgi:DNA-binding transcriptional ArsR family regulator